MPATVIDLPIEQGATFRGVVTWRGQDANGALVPIDLTGYTAARMQVRRTQKSAVLVELTAEPDGGLTLGGVDGAIAIHLTPAQTNLLTAKVGAYDLEVTAPNGDIYRVCKGKVTVDPNITQDETDPIVGV